MIAAISVVVAILGLILGVARYISARRKSAVDVAIGAAKVENVALIETVKAAQERIKTDAEVVGLRDDDADTRLDKWMRD